MSKAIYLNGVEVTLIEQQGINLKTLSWLKLSGLLNRADYLVILERTQRVTKIGGFLRDLGLRIVEGCGSLNATETLTDQSPILLEEGFIVNAVMGADNTLVLWPEAGEYKTIHDMYKYSRLNILKAMSTVMMFNEVKQSEIFKAAFIAEGINDVDFR